MKILGILLLSYIVLFKFPFALYLSAKMSGLKVTFWQLIKNRINKIPSPKLVEWNIKLITNGYDIGFVELTELYKEKVDLDNVVNGLVESKKHGLEISIEEALKADNENINICSTVLNTISHVEKED